jgi:hypothetical protein
MRREADGLTRTQRARLAQPVPLKQELSHYRKRSDPLQRLWAMLPFRVAMARVAHAPPGD